MSSLLRFLENGTAELARAFARSSDIQRLLAGACGADDYRRLLERLRRGFAVIELQAFAGLPEPVHARLKTHRMTWRLRHDIGILGGTAPLPARAEDLENAGRFSTASAKLGAQFALTLVLDSIARGQQALTACLGPALVSCLLFNGRRAAGEPQFAAVVRSVIEDRADEIDWSEAMAAARRTLRTLRHALAETPRPA
ncbi:MAG: hypothetical protein H6852_04735 [Geminicoccaceae bacterium]|jgi:hypothetical protein|nr:hypothetical protein [Geminicoccaceae bacterium]MCB9966932.1 hypothetical protein [Geminicoccaceae bacterium]HRY24020.1 hypothetical protein [Geminicoccaceae bacterium]